MESLLSTFHVEWSLLLAQVVNFAIVVGVLWFWAFRPLGKLLDKRRRDIEEGVEKAKKSETLLLAAEDDAKMIVKSAEVKAAKVVTEGYDQARDFSRRAVQEAQVERLKIVSQAEADIKVKEREAEGRLKEQTVDLVIHGIEKILKEEFTSIEQDKLVAKLKSYL